jgi:hypothetical protein
MPRKRKKPHVCDVDVDEATYVGDGEDGCYYDAAADHDGKWYTSVIVDCDTAGFVDTLIQDDGPYDTFEAAMEAGRHYAEDWCVTNGVALDDPDETEEEEV